MKTPPVVSVLLLSWNHERFIEQCIQSIAGQTYRHIEIVYLDNVSSDHTYQKGMDLLEATGFRFSCYRNTQPRKITENFNFLLSKATGDYIVPLSTDDWLDPCFFEEKVRFLESRPTVGMVYNGGWVYYEDTRQLEPVDTSNFRRGRIYKELLQESNVIFFVGCCYRKSVLDDVGGWDENLLIEDMDMFIRIATRYDIDYIDKPLVYYRKMNSSAANNIDFMVKGWEQYFQKYKAVEWCNMKAWLAEKYRSYAALSVDQKKMERPLELIGKSLRLAPFRLATYRTFLYYLRARFTK